MELIWATQALVDVDRVYQFLAPVAPGATARLIQELAAAAVRLTDYPRLGTQIKQFHTVEVRRRISGSYEMRYSVKPNQLVILRVWSTREDR